MLQSACARWRKALQLVRQYSGRYIKWKSVLLVWLRNAMWVDISLRMLTVKVNNSSKDKDCLLCEQHVGKERWSQAHCCRRNIQNVILGT
jgi:hypothetical protein